MTVTIQNTNGASGKTPKHPAGPKAKVLLSSVFGPYAQDDEYGSRKINPMELYHNQVTRVQEQFSLRMFHRSFGLIMLQANIDAPCTLLDFPTLERFEEELRENRYDVVGISAIMPNVRKVAKMCELVRTHQPEAEIVIGGHVVNLPGIKGRVDADHFVKGDGVRWLREYLGEDPDRPYKHPLVISGFGSRAFGMTFPAKSNDVAAMLMPSVGCPMGCNFCSTSAMFGGKGRFVNFYETGDELFDVMSQIEEGLKIQSFFIMDENFLLHKKRALRLLELMEENDKSWSLYVFSSAGAIKSYTMDQLVRLGISRVWMGLEGRKSQYSKLDGIDTKRLVRELQDNGISVLGSSIIGLEEHGPDNIDEAIEWAVDHASDSHQFMLYTPIPGTPLYAEHMAKGDLKGEDEVDIADTHGQYRFNFNHPNIKDGQEEEFLLRAFRKDFEVNGPSLGRMFRTALNGWRMHKNHPDARVRRRFKYDARRLDTWLAGVVWMMRRWYRKDHAMRANIDGLLQDIYGEFGLKARFFSVVGGLYLSWTGRREHKRLSRGWTYEPRTFYDMNRAAIELFMADKRSSKVDFSEIKSVLAKAGPSPS